MERAGKWRELDYTAPVYPSFACGAGNVLSADLVRWLALNAAHLKPYQVQACTNLIDIVQLETHKDC